MKTLPLILLAGATLLSACDNKTDQTVDRFIDSKSLQNLTKTPGIWVDGDGCEHWAKKLSSVASLQMFVLNLSTKFFT